MECVPYRGTDGVEANALRLGVAFDIGEGNESAISLERDRGWKCTTWKHSHPRLWGGDYPCPDRVRAHVEVAPSDHRQYRRHAGGEQWRRTDVSWAPDGKRMNPAHMNDQAQ